ncbi:ATP-binding protein [Patescibacteria group bacterium]|nr:ATP-binding protein [Patescibacteria group bacterium]
MVNPSKKEIFKFLIKEFHTQPLPFAIKRELEIPLSSNKIITIYGPRRSGKSFYFFYLIQELIKKNVVKERILYLNFEDDRILPLAYKEFDLILEAYFELYPENKKEKIFLFFDEIQNIKNWEIFIRRIYDKENSQIFITGSSSKLLSKEIATSLRGRTLSYSLFPLNFREFLSFKEEKLKRDFQYTSQRFRVKKLLEEFIEWGGFPEIVLEKDFVLKRKILEEYFNLLIYRDLVDRFSLNNIDLLKDLLKYLFTNFTSTFSINSYYNLTKQKLSLSRETISRYLSCIEESLHLFLLPKFSYSLKVQKVNPKKIICLDNGLRNIISFRFSQDKGKLVENLVGFELIKKGKIFYWSNKQEVDFIKKEETGLTAVNVCYSNLVKDREAKSLLEFQKNFRWLKKRMIITEDKEGEEKINGKTIKFTPLWKWLLGQNRAISKL